MLDAMPLAPSHTPEARKRWRDANPEKVKAQKRRSYERCRERILAQKKSARDADPEANRAKVRAWTEANPDRARERKRLAQARRRAELHDAYVEDVIPLVLLELHDGVCGICDEDVDPLDFEVDHIIPLSRNGEHSYANTQPAHPRCNRSKGPR